MALSTKLLIANESINVHFESELSCIQSDKDQLVSAMCYFWGTLKCFIPCVDNWLLCHLLESLTSQGVASIIESVFIWQSNLYSG